MKTKSIIPCPRPLPSSVALLNRLLLTETCSHTNLTPWKNLAPDLLTIRATKVSVLLKELLALKGYGHGGING
jgi:hypothetical protein